MTVRGSHASVPTACLIGIRKRKREGSASTLVALLVFFQEMPGRGAMQARPAGYHSTMLCENTTSISVPEPAAVLMWNLARLASTSALVSERLTGEPSSD
jgi:hypothetical protein